MTWFRSDDGFPEHAKTDRLEAVTGGGYPYAAARCVWHDMGCDCSARLTDGAFDTSRALRVVRLPKAVVLRALENLAAAGLIESRGENLWAFHDWMDYQPSRSSVLAQRDAAKERQRESRAKRTVSQRDTAVTHSAVTPSVTAPRPDPTRPDPTKEEKTHPPPVRVQSRRAADETPSARAVEAPSAPAPTRSATHRHDLPAVAVEEAMIAATGGRLRLTAAPAPVGAAIVERLRREGVTVEELPRVAAVIGADGGRLLWPWPADLRITPEALAKPALPDGGGWGCERVGEAVAAARDGGVEALRRRAATSTRPARAGDKLAHLRAPMARPEDFARDAAAIEATKIQDPAERRAALAALGVSEADAPF